MAEIVSRVARPCSFRRTVEHKLRRIRERPAAGGLFVAATFGGLLQSLCQNCDRTGCARAAEPARGFSCDSLENGPGMVSAERHAARVDRFAVARNEEQLWLGMAEWISLILIRS
jgi:hypothetical protein